ncbi:uncharacterized protein CEXT_774841 [Caerostris extrusa]|uniref:Uncharacterized protein n=1 Tax=Caerostris extrusa TaxID=172846 RepID=A0AAV4XDP3_CAEEX|nr:uncharacterized protein CEXT_774841 [Caerostris extrusa]
MGCKNSLGPEQYVYRGGQLTPMQWTADNFSGGFTDNLTTAWFPVNPDHFATNVERTSRISWKEPTTGTSPKESSWQPTSGTCLKKEFPEAYGNVKVITTTAGPTRTRVRSRSFTLSPGAAFVAEVTLLYYASPAVLSD